MPLKPYAVVDLTPEEVRDETLLPATGGPVYLFALPDEYVELLAKGIVPEALSRRCYANLEWKRMHARSEARTRA